MSQKEGDALSRPLTDTEQMLVELARRDERKKISKDIFIAGAVAGGTMARKLASDEEWRKWLTEEVARRYPDAPQPEAAPVVLPFLGAGHYPAEAAPVAKTRRCRDAACVDGMRYGEPCPICGGPVEEVSEGGTP